jgi:hypothetical protein
MIVLGKRFKMSPASEKRHRNIDAGAIGQPEICITALFVV